MAPKKAVKVLARKPRAIPHAPGNAGQPPTKRRGTRGPMPQKIS